MGENNNIFDKNIGYDELRDDENYDKSIDKEKQKERFSPKKRSNLRNPYNKYERPLFNNENHYNECENSNSISKNFNDINDKKDIYDSRSPNRRNHNYQNYNSNNKLS